MALIGVIKPLTYSTVDCDYSKTRSYMQINVQVWEDSSKKVLLTELCYGLNGNKTNYEAESVITSLPKNPKVGMYLVEETTDEVLYAHVGLIANYSDDTWAFNFPMEGESLPIYIKDRGTYLKRNIVTEKGDSFHPVWIEDPNEVDRNSFQKWFGMDKIGGVDEKGRPRDILRAAYEYLMSRSDFSEVVVG